MRRRISALAEVSNNTRDTKRLKSLAATSAKGASFTLLVATMIGTSVGISNAAVHAVTGVMKDEGVVLASTIDEDALSEDIGVNAAAPSVKPESLTSASIDPSSLVKHTTKQSNDVEPLVVTSNGDVEVSTPVDPPLDDSSVLLDENIRSVLENPTSSTLVSIEQEWDSGEEIGVVAAEPEPEPEVIVPEVSTPGVDQTTSNPTPTPNPAPAPAPVVSSGDNAALRQSIVDMALGYVGYPYVWGASGPYAFDCSGLVQYVYGAHGIGLPRTSGAQGASGRWISYEDALPGDLVVWGSHHIAIYLGNGQIVHASTPSTGVKIGSLYGSYYFSRVI